MADRVCGAAGDRLRALRRHGDTKVAAREVSVQICPACFAAILGAAEQCTACGADLARLSARDYREKLIAALGHPLAEVPMRAIVALGLRGETEGGTALVECALRHPADIVEGLEIVRGLALLRAPHARRGFLSQLACRHPAHAVLQAAQKTLLDEEKEHADH